MTEHDRNWGPFTVGPWTKLFSIRLTGADEDEAITYFTLVGFGWALRIKMPFNIKPAGGFNEKEYGISLHDMGNGYDFLIVKFGQQTHDSRTTKDWCKHLPWKQWRCVRSSVYTPVGDHFATQAGDFFEFMRVRETCPSEQFEIEDYDGKRIIATCFIEEREWHRGEGWFRWMKWFWPAKIHRSLDIRFSEEVGPGKNDWKGGTIGHGIDMQKGETPLDAFKRYCEGEKRSKYKNYRIKFIGPVKRD
jgi:hypothetical protein